MDLKTGRKLKAADSHPDASNKKTSAAEATEDTHADMAVPSSDDNMGEKDGDVDVESMLKMILKEVKSVKHEIKAVAQSSEKALNDFKADVKEDLSRVEANIDNLTIDARDHRQDLDALKVQFTEFKNGGVARSGGGKGD